MEKYYPKLNREFFSVNPSLSQRSMLEIKCLKCFCSWEIPKIDALKEAGMLRLLDHEYKHKNKKKNKK